MLELQHEKFDYSEIVSKFMVFIGAGLSIRTAWENIVDDYEREGKQRYAYEEMAISLAGLKTGVHKSKALFLVLKNLLKNTPPPYPSRPPSRMYLVSRYSSSPCLPPSRPRPLSFTPPKRSEEHTSELQSRTYLVCRLLLEKKNQ